MRPSLLGCVLFIFSFHCTRDYLPPFIFCIKIYSNSITENVDLFPIMLHNSDVEFDNTLFQSIRIVMFMEERHQEISETIQLNGKITIAEITNKYGISDESARRDLRLLEQKGICKRTHGGFETEIQPEAAAKPDADAAAL